MLGRNRRVGLDGVVVKAPASSRLSTIGSKSCTRTDLYLHDRFYFALVDDPKSVQSDIFGEGLSRLPVQTDISTGKA